MKISSTFLRILFVGSTQLAILFKRIFVVSAVFTRPVPDHSVHWDYAEKLVLCVLTISIIPSIKQKIKRNLSLSLSLSMQASFHASTWAKITARNWPHACCYNERTLKYNFQRVSSKSILFPSVCQSSIT